MRVAIAGHAGTGKTTAARLVAEALGLRLVSAGAVFRAIARERGLTLEAFSRIAETDESIDKALDERMLEAAREDGVLLEGRLVAWLVTMNRVPALRVYLEAPQEVRAQRVAGRDSISIEKALETNRLRERSERSRYRAIYGVFMDDPAYYDLRLSTDKYTPEELAERIALEARRRA